MRLPVYVISLALVLVACGSSDPAGSTTASIDAGQTTPPSTASTTKPTVDRETTATTLPAAEANTVRHPDGLTFEFPEGWEASQVELSTAFANGANCVSARIVDFQPPEDSGPSPGILHSVVQACSRPADGTSLEKFVSDVYGETSVMPVPVELAGTEGWEVDDGTGRIIYLQTDSHRFQIVTSVVAEPEVAPLRFAQVEEILQSVQFD